jgi:hypothetical protein
VALALMDENLNLIPDTDILIDINAGPGYGKYFRQWRADCRIFGMRGNVLLMCNEHLHLIEIIRQPPATMQNFKDDKDYATRDNHSLPYLYPNMYGNGLQVILHNVHHKVGDGKNFNIFTSPKNQTNSDSTDDALDYYIQLYPIPHRYRRVALPAPDEQYPIALKGGVQTSTTSIPPNSFTTIDVLHPIRTCPKNSKNNGTQDNIGNNNEDDNNNNINGNNCTNPVDTPFWEMHEDHGTACCVSVGLPSQDGKDHQSVWVGISHNKLSLRDKFWFDDILHRYDDLLKDQYVSRFVAYSKTPPFDIVAVSGYFCLGHYSEPATTATATLAGRHRHVRLSLFNETFECPPIHFPSAFTEHVGDSSKAIIGYGVNDCYPMLIVVEKQDIVNRLLGRGFKTQK